MQKQRGKTEGKMTIDEIRAAATRLEGHAVRTPLLESELLNRRAGRRVLVKAECLQVTGSFKFRGAWSALTAIEPDRRAAGVIAFSSGNHAQGVAEAARRIGIPAVIVMPADAPAAKIANTRAYGAQIVLYDRVREDREAIGREIAETRRMTLVPPYDDAMVIAGQGTVGLEIAEQAHAAGVEHADVLIPCSGGGLASGVALALEAEGRGMRVRTCEPAGFDDFARSLVAGAPQRNAAAAGSIQDALMAATPGVLTWGVGRRLFGSGLAVSDVEAQDAMRAAFERLRLVLEPGGACALGAALHRPEEISGDAVIVVASGGNVDPATFRRALDGGMG